MCSEDTGAFGSTGSVRGVNAGDCSESKGKSYRVVDGELGRVLVVVLRRDGNHHVVIDGHGKHRIAGGEGSDNTAYSW